MGIITELRDRFKPKVK